MSKMVVLVALAACGTTTYSYQYKSLQQFGVGEQPEPAPREARDLLATAKTVAFFPPDQCVNSDPSQARSQEIRAQCGAMMSALEDAAKSAGYEVLSWQNLRGYGKRPIDFARESNVDVLFEVNQLQADPIDDVSVKHNFTFTEGEGAPLDVSTSLAETCRDYAFKADPPKAAALAGRVDIKLVSVSDGRDRWHYTKTQDRGLDRAYPRVSFTAPNRESTLTRVLLTVGVVGLGVGTGLYLGEQLSTDDPTTPTNEKVDTGGWSTGLMLAGGVATVAAIAVAVGTGGEKPAVATTLCNGNFAAASAAPARAEVMSSEHTFEHTATADPLDQARRELIGEMTQQFIEELKAAHSMRPAPAPAPAPAPPPVPPAAPAPAHP